MITGKYLHPVGINLPATKDTVMQQKAGMTAWGKTADFQLESCNLKIIFYIYFCGNPSTHGAMCKIYRSSTPVQV